MRVTAEPCVLFPSLGRHFHPQAYASAGRVLSSTKDVSDTTRFLAQGRISADFGLAIGPTGKERFPDFLELTGVYTSFAAGDFEMVLGADSKRSLLTRVERLHVETCLAGRYGFALRIANYARGAAPLG